MKELLKLLHLNLLNVTGALQTKKLEMRKLNVLIATNYYTN